MLFIVGFGSVMGKNESLTFVELNSICDYDFFVDHLLDLIACESGDLHCVK